MSIKGVPVRATITISNYIVVRTPFILSFNVSRQRGAPATFDASIKISHDELRGAVAGGSIIIEAGTKGSEKRIFTGMIKKATINPCFDDPYFVRMDISGGDTLSMLEGKRYTRRCRATKGSYATIQSVTREGLKSKRFAYSDANNGFDITPGELEAENKVTNTTQGADIKNIGAPPPRQQEAGSVDFNIMNEPTAGGGA